MMMKEIVVNATELLLAPSTYLDDIGYDESRTKEPSLASIAKYIYIYRERDYLIE